MIEPEDMLRAAVTAGPWPIRALRELMYEAGEKKWRVDHAAHTLMAAGELVTVRATYWCRPGFWNPERGNSLWIDGHSRAELIRRLAEHAPSSHRHTAPTTTDELMQGDDAMRLAARAYDYEVESWRRK